MLVEPLESRTLMSLAADANGDNRVDTLDFNVMALHFGQGVAGKFQGDFNGDAKVNAIDFNVLAAEFGAVMADNALSEDVEINNDSSWSLGHKPQAGERVVINSTDVQIDAITNSGGAQTWEDLQINGNGVSLSLASLNVTVSDDAEVNNMDSVTFGSLGGDLTGVTNNEITITTKTGNGSIGASDTVIITDLGTSDVTIAASCDALTINGGQASSSVTWSSGSQNDQPHGTIGSGFHGELIAGAGAGVDLQNSTLASNVVLTGPGTFSNYTQPYQGNASFSGLSASYAVGDTVTITYSADRKATGFVPTGITDGNDDFLATFAVNTTTRTITGTVTQAWYDYGQADDRGGVIPGAELRDSNNSISIPLPAITVTAAAAATTAVTQPPLAGLMQGSLRRGLLRGALRR